MFTVSLYRYQQPFLEPSLFSAPFREGYILKLIDEMGIEGYGEIAPLPGFSTETLKDILSDLPRVFHSSVEPSSVFPSVAFGLESAYLDILAKQKQCRMNQVFSAISPEFVWVHTLLSGNTKACVAQAKQARSRGINVFKLKIGSASLHDEIERVRSVCEVLGSEFTLRLDGNRNLSFEFAHSFFSELSDCPVDYIEEPFLSLELSAQLFDQCGVYTALDDSIYKNEITSFDSFPYVKAVVIKPMLYGGIQRVLDLAQLAQNSRKIVVFSSAYESPVSRIVLANLASVVCPGTFHGLDVGSVFSEFPFVENPIISEGKLQLPQQLSIQDSLLESIDIEPD